MDLDGIEAEVIYSDTAAGNHTNDGRSDPGLKVKDVTERLDAYFEELGDWGLAIMAMRDPEAARALKATGRINNPDAYKFVQEAVFGPNGAPDGPESIVRLGWDTNGFNLDAYKQAGAQLD